MTDFVDKKTYTFFMPGEERIYFRYFHLIAIALLLIVIAFQVVTSEASVKEAVVTALVFVSPVYFVYFVFGKRFADSVTLDFNARKVRFSFSFPTKEVRLKGIFRISRKSILDSILRL